MAALSVQFYRAWASVADARKFELFEVWNSGREFTKLIIHAENSVLLNIGELLDLKCYNADYYYTDAVFFQSEDILPEHPQAYYLTNIRIAFEHENDFFSGLFQEACHLLQIDCELKVLVAYPPDPSAEMSELQYLHKIISRSSRAKEISKDERFLVITGYREPYQWNGWLFQTDGWIKLAIPHDQECSMEHIPNSDWS